ncbi:hypothetical protein D3C81_298070 [compost metagenome]
MFAVGHKYGFRPIKDGLDNASKAQPELLYLKVTFSSRVQSTGFVGGYIEKMLLPRSIPMDRA